MRVFDFEGHKYRVEGRTSGYGTHFYKVRRSAGAPWPAESKAWFDAVDDGYTFGGRTDRRSPKDNVRIVACHFD